MNHVSFRSEENIINFSEKRLNPMEAHEVIQRYKSVGLGNKALIDDAMGRGDFISVLSYVWGERDKGVKLQWLREQEGNLHATLMYELAIAEFSASPTVETVNKISIPLIKAATLRVMQDAACSQDESVKGGDAPWRLENVYTASLDRRVQELLGKKLEEITGELPKLQRGIYSKGIQVLKESISKPLPNPKWLDADGRYVYSQEECRKIREAFAHEQVKIIEKAIEALA